MRKQQKASSKKFFTSDGLEPAIPGLGGRCLIHWATEAYINVVLIMNVFCAVCIIIHFLFLNNTLKHSKCISRISLCKQDNQVDDSMNRFNCFDSYIIFSKF